MGIKVYPPLNPSQFQGGLLPIGSKLDQYGRREDAIVLKGGPKHGEQHSVLIGTRRIEVIRDVPVNMVGRGKLSEPTGPALHRDYYEFDGVDHASGLVVFRYVKVPCGSTCGWCDYPCTKASRHSFNWYEAHEVCWFCGLDHPQGITQEDPDDDEQEALVDDALRR